MGLRHEPVMVGEVVSLLGVAPGGSYLDATVGGGGHTESILQASAPDGRVLGIDRDAEAVARCEERLKSYSSRIVLRQGAFSDVTRIATEAGFIGLDGILFDLGISVEQLVSPERGFGFQIQGPLDMRMDRGGGRSATDLINALSEEELSRYIRDLGEERWHRRIAAGIVRERTAAPIATTNRLVEVILRSLPKGRARGRIHPATRTFQAIRIAVNDELEQLRAALPQALDLLRPGGRLSVISFHSLEDRIVKETFRGWAKGCICPPRLPVCRCGRRPRGVIITRRPVVPSEDEIRRNPRSRSAKLRAFHCAEAS